MKLEGTDQEQAIVRFTYFELLWIHSALNEICHGLYRSELVRTKHYVDAGDALRLLEILSDVLSRMRGGGHPPDLG